jgi:hypothetical protein
MRGSLKRLLRLAWNRSNVSREQKSVLLLSHIVVAFEAYVQRVAAQ